MIVENMETIHKTIRISRLVLCCLLITAGSLFSALAQTDYKLVEEPGCFMDVLLDGKPVARYMTAYAPSSNPKDLTSTNKPYLHVFDPHGKTPITNSGTGGDHPHHRGIMIGWTKVTWNQKQYNFWGMYNNAQVHRGFSVKEANSQHAKFTSLVDWITHTGETIIKEERTVVVQRADKPAYVNLDVISALQACRGDVFLDGDPEHAGVQFRAANEAERTATFFAYPGEKTDPRKIVDPPWVAGQFNLGGKTYSVLQINHPANPCGAKISAYRNYCRFGYFPAPVTLTPDQPYILRYRFLVADGKIPSAEWLQRACDAYTGNKGAAAPMTLCPAE